MQIRDVLSHSLHSQRTGNNPNQVASELNKLQCNSTAGETEQVSPNPEEGTGAEGILPGCPVTPAERPHTHGMSGRTQETL